MGLLTDGECTSVEDLVAYDSGVLEVCRDEGIDIAKKLVLATEETGIEVGAFLRRRNARHELSGAPLTEEHVVSTRAMRLYHLLHTLVLIYSDAAYTQLNDKYKKKYELYLAREASAMRLLYQVGVGVVATPVKRAAAAQVEGEGTGAVSGLYVVQLSYCAGFGAEGASGPAVVSLAENCEGLRIAPSETLPPEWRWHAYIGTEASEPRRQTAEGLAAGQSLFFTGELAASDIRPAEGQSPDSYVRFARTL